MRTRFAAIAAAIVLAAGCGGKKEKDVAPGSARPLDAAVAESPGKVIGTALGGRWLVARDRRVYSGATEAVWGQLRGGDKWEMASLPGLGSDHTFVVEGGAVYWVDRASGGLARAALPDGLDAAVVAKPTSPPRAPGVVLAGDGTTAVWRVDGLLMKAPLAGGDLIALAPSADDGPVVVAGARVIHAVPDGLAVVGLDGKGKVDLALGQGRVVSIASDGAKAYWLTSAGAVRSALLPGAGREEVKDLATLAGATALALAPEGVYVAAGPDIVRVPLEGGAPEVAVARAGAPVALLVDGDDVIWIDGKESLVYIRRRVR